MAVKPGSEKKAGKAADAQAMLYLVKTLVESFGGKVELRDRIEGDCT